jgi:hypothetical protein
MRLDVSEDGTLKWHELVSELRFAAKLDDKEYEVTGSNDSATGIKVSVRWADRRRLEVTSRKQGKAFQIDTWALSADGQTIVNEAKNPDTGEQISVFTYERQ